MIKELTKEEIAKQVYPDVEGYLDQVEHDRLQFIKGLEYSDQNTKPLIDEIAELKSQLLISEQKVKLNYNCAIESSKSEASDAVTWDSIYIEYMNECSNWKDEKCMSITEWLKLNYNIPTRNNK